MLKTVVIVAVMGSVCLGLSAQIIVKQDNDTNDASPRIVMQVGAQRPYQKSDGQPFTPVIGLECSQHEGGERVRTFFFMPGEIRTASEVRMKVDDGNLSARPLNTRPDGALAADFKPPLAILDGKTLYVEFSPASASGSIISEFDIRGLQEEFAKHSECIAPLPPVPESVSSAKKPGTAFGGKPKADKYQTDIEVVQWGSDGGSCWAVLRADGMNYRVEQLGFLHCTVLRVREHVMGRIWHDFLGEYWVEFPYNQEKDGKRKLAKYKVISMFR